MRKLFFIQLIIAILLVVGEVKCIVKAINCDWNPVGKAEVIYTAAACCGLGSIVGWFDIEDVPQGVAVKVETVQVE